MKSMRIVTIVKLQPLSEELINTCTCTAERTKMKKTMMRKMMRMNMRKILSMNWEEQVTPTSVTVCFSHLMKGYEILLIYFLFILGIYPDQ